MGGLDQRAWWVGMGGGKGEGGKRRVLGAGSRCNELVWKARVKGLGVRRRGWP